VQVVVRFKAVGNAPIMKQNFYKITASNRFQAVIQFLRKELGWKSSDPLFTYINLAFSPAPDDTVSNLFKSFATDNHLIVNYRCVLPIVGSEVPCSNVWVARPPRGAEPVDHHPEHHASRPSYFRYDGAHLPSPAKAPTSWGSIRCRRNSFLSVGWRQGRHQPRVGSVTSSRRSNMYIYSRSRMSNVVTGLDEQAEIINALPGLSLQRR
jgi:ubiquitin-like protein ATG12